MLLWLVFTLSRRSTNKSSGTLLATLWLSRCFFAAFNLTDNHRVRVVDGTSNCGPSSFAPDAVAGGKRAAYHDVEDAASLPGPLPCL
jgi:hypothetical protein